MTARAFSASARIQATATTIATCPGPGPWQVTAIYVAGDETNDRTITVYIVPSGGTADETTRFAVNVPIPAVDVLDFELASPLYLQPNGTVQILADVADETVGFVSMLELR